MMTVIIIVKVLGDLGSRVNNVIFIWCKDTKYKKTEKAGVKLLFAMFWSNK